MAKMTKYGTVEEYLADQPEDVRATLEHVRRSVKASGSSTVSRSPGAAPRRGSFRAVRHR